MNNKHGQAPSRVITHKRIADRSQSEMIGLCKGMLSDGKVNQQEAEYLQEWLNANESVKDVWPGSIIYTRIIEYLEDGVLDADERQDLFELLANLTGYQEQYIGLNTSTRLPFDQPMPELEFDGTDFCLTGKFAYGTRSDCEVAISSLGGHLCGNPLQRGCVLVVGFLGSRDWIQTTHGRKIEKAVSLREAGWPVKIVSEDHWAEAMFREFGLGV